jgi:hypothetical protein
MTPRRFGSLLPLGLLLACAGGTSMRVSKDDAGGDEPVALSPAPESGPAPTERTGDSLASTPAPETDSAAALAGQESGYSSYGNGTSMELKRIGQWTRTGVGEARRLIIRDANAWAQFWSELGVGEQPTVDFTRDVVVAVAAGQRPTGGYEIAIDRVRENNGELTIEVVETAPGPNCMTTASLTQPVDVIAIPSLTFQSWSFSERKAVRGCH